jgi:probable lipoprotein NlpC
LNINTVYSYRIAVLGFVVLLALAGCKSSSPSSGYSKFSQASPKVGKGVMPGKSSKTAKNTKSSKKGKAVNSYKPAEETLITDAKPLEEEVIEQVISITRTYYGTPYRFGGSSRSGMDCSGLLTTCFNEVGLHLPRSSTEQSTVGHEVSLAEVKPGDLIFFSTEKGKGINHVGLVTQADDGEIVFIHSTVSKGVMEDKLSTPYYKRAYVKARRPSYIN